MGSGIKYFIEPNKAYEVYRNDYNGRAYYKIKVETTNANKERIEGYKNISFSEDIDIEDGTLIIIKSAFESFYFKRTDKYNPVFILVVTDFDYATPKNMEQYTPNDFDDFDNF